MAVTHKLIQTITVGAGGAASIEFTSIPQTYTDLILMISSRATGAAIDVQAIVINGGTTTMTSAIYLDSNNSGTPRSGSLYYYQALSQPSSYTANVFASSNIYIAGYSSTTASKTLSAESALETNASGSYIGFTASFWNSTAAITTLSIQNQNGNFVQYSSASLYGISKN